MLVFNALLFISGLTLVGLGSWFLIDLNDLKEVVEEDPLITNCAFGMIAAGVLLLIIGCIGCAGALRERRWCIGIYFGAVLLLFIVQVCLVVLAFINQGSIEKLAKQSMHKYNSVSAVKEAWDAVQEKHQCCGYNSPVDWVEAFGEGITDCGESADGETKLTLDWKGCEEVFDVYFRVLQIAACAIAAIELLTMVFSICLCRRIGKDLASGYTMGESQ